MERLWFAVDTDENHDRRMKRRICWLLVAVFTFFWAFDHSAFAHDHWVNGVVVPPWVKSSCCGVDDVHHLKDEQVKALKDGWHVDGFHQTIAYGKELPSQDGDYWIFYKTFPDGTQTQAYCFFAPAQGF